MKKYLFPRQQSAKKNNLEIRNLNDHVLVKNHKNEEMDSKLNRSNKIKGSISSGICIT
jgi:hypothetical protein